MAALDGKQRRPLHHRAAKHLGRGAHHLLAWLGSAGALIILLAIVAIWRLMQGPIELDWLAPYVEAAFERSGMGLKVTVAGVRLGIDRDTRQLDLWGENVRVSRPGGTLVSFPQIATSFALREMLGGRLEPTRVVIERPVLYLSRDADGAVSAQVAAAENAPGENAAGETAFGPEMLEQLAGPPQQDTPLALLRQIGIRGATVIIDDRRADRTWRASPVDIAIERGAKGVRGDISFAVPMAGSVPELHATYRYLAERRLLDLELAIDGVQPASLPTLIPELAQLQHVEAPVSGTLRVRFDVAAGRAQGSRLDLTLGKGRLHSDWLPAGGILVEKGELRASYAPEKSEIQVESLSADLGGGAQLALGGTLGGVTPELFAAPADARPPGHVTGKFDAAVRHVTAARFDNLWPNGFAGGARRWVVENIRDGVLDEAAVKVALDLDPVAHTANLLNATGTMRYRDMTVNYFNGLPPVYKAGGSAVFTGKSLEFLPNAGTLKGLKLTGGSLLITEIGQKVEWLTIDVGLAGPLQDALEVIDSKPLHYARGIGVDPAHVTGRTETQLHFKLPLLADLKIEQVEYAAKATIAGASIDKPVMGRRITDANVGLDLNRTGAHAQGVIRYDGIPAKLDANVYFHPKSGPNALYRVALTLDNEAQRRLEFDVAGDRLNGPVAADVTYAAFAENRGEVTALLDLRGATLAVPEAGWKKPAEQPGTAKIVLNLENETIARVPQIEVRAAGLDGRLAASVGPDRKQIERVDIRRLIIGDADVTGSVTRRPGGGWRADIHAARVNARNLLKDAAGGAPGASTMPLAVNARIDRLVLGPARELHYVSAEMLRTGGVWQSARIEGRHTNGRSLALRFGEAGGHRLVFHSDDLGATLKLFDIADDIAGGQVTLDGQLFEIDGRRTLRAHLEGENYVIERTPTVARILALPSLTGLASTLSGTGLPFMTLRGDLVYSGSRVTLERMLAFGESIGLTANGWVDLDRDRLELQGTVAPAFALNSLLGNVPIVGELFGGGSQGLFAANYRLTGSTSDPQVSVNPLSALAPGILRQLFAPLVGFPPPQPDQPPPH